VLLVDKPAGPTSHDVVGKTRGALGTRKVGHAGTLDPPATGLLVVLVGRATRLNRFVAMLPKVYEGTVRFGWETTTDDATGERMGAPDESWRSLGDAAIAGALADIRARPEQVPPAVSARKIAGERAYQLARRGERHEMRPAPVTIYRIDAAYPRAPGTPELRIRVTCGAGTYIRAIARDLGRALGTAAHLAALRRVQIGAWHVDRAIAMDAITAEAVAGALLPMAAAVAHLPRVELDDVSAQRFRFGQRLGAPPSLEGAAAVFAGAELIGVAEVHDGLLRPAVGLAS
jgi:tRNA pseudouridine55 synthase